MAYIICLIDLKPKRINDQFGINVSRKRLRYEIGLLRNSIKLWIDKHFLLPTTSPPVKSHQSTINNFWIFSRHQTSVYFISWYSRTPTAKVTFPDVYTVQILCHWCPPYLFERMKCSNCGRGHLHSITVTRVVWTIRVFTNIAFNVNTLM